MKEQLALADFGGHDRTGADPVEKALLSNLRHHRKRLAAAPRPAPVKDP
jgi:hypothetical protein